MNMYSINFEIFAHAWRNCSTENISLPLLLFYAILFIEIKSISRAESDFCPVFFFSHNLFFFRSLEMDLKVVMQNEKNMGKNPLQQYKKEDFLALDKEIFTKKSTPETLDELRNEAVDMYSQESSYSICLHYIAGRIKLEARPHEFNMDLNNTLLNFYDARNWEVVKHLGTLIISKGANSIAYRILGDVAHEDGDDELMWRYYEKYVKSDNNDKDIILRLAEHYSEMGDKKEANVFYQRAILRLRVPEDNAKVEKTFSNLLDLERSGYAFYYKYALSVKEKDPEMALVLFKKLLSYLKDGKERLKSEGNKASEIRKNSEDTVEVIKEILMINGSEEGMREELVRVLKERYSSSSRLSECLKKYDFRRSNNIEASIDGFEKEIAYTKGSFVYQKSTRRVGKIEDITNNIVTVRYSGNEEPQKIVLESAFNALTPLTNQNIKAIKKGVPAQKIRAKIMAEDGVSWLVRTLLYSAENPKGISLKEMKSEVVPQILSEDDWQHINKDIKNELRTNEYVKTNPGPTDTYILMSFPQSPDEKALSVFKGMSSFDDKLDKFLDVSRDKDIAKDGDAMLEMVSYFSQIIKKEDESISKRLSSILALEYVSEDNSVSVQIEMPFEELYKKIDLKERVRAFEEMKNTTVRKLFVDRVFQADRYAEDVIQEIFALYPSYIIDKFRRYAKGKYYLEYLEKVIELYKENMAAFIFLLQEAKDEDLKKIGKSRKDILITALRALSYVASTSQFSIQDQKKFKSALRKVLIDENGAFHLIEQADDQDKDDIKVYISQNLGIETEEKIRLEERLKKRWPDITFNKGEKIVERPTRRVITGFLTLESSYDKKQAELKEINTVDMPQILKEINTARELGDLRENSEYQYAKEHKRELERRIGELTHDLTTVRIMRKEDVLPDLIGFGTKVTLKDNNSGEELYYTFLGRWESRPEDRIIDINAPLGKSLVNHKEGDEVHFSINGKDYDYTVLKIEVIL